MPFPDFEKKKEFQMADNRNIDEVLSAFERQIADLRKETSRIADSLAERGIDMEHLRDRGRAAYDGAARGMRQAARYARKEGTAVAGTIREHPATTTSALAAAGLIGLALWWYLDASDRRRHW
jgi:hypothetical protein